MVADAILLLNEFPQLDKGIFVVMIVDYYYKLREQPHGRTHKTAVIASINRLLKTIHYLIVNDKLYDYQKAPH